MSFHIWQAMIHNRLGRIKNRVKIEYPIVEPGDLFSVQLPTGQQFLQDLKNNKIRGLLVLGSTGSGKSSSLEDLAEYYITRGETVIDLHSAYWEGVYWARKYPVILVQAPSRFQVRSENENITVYTWSENFDWLNILKEARERKAILVTSCWLPEENYYIMLTEFLEALLNPLHTHTRVVLIRDLVSLLPSGLKESSSKELVELKRKMLLFVRQGRKVGNRILADTQIAEDILRSFRENVWVKIYKYYEGRLENIPEEINVEINKLGEEDAIIHYKGFWFGASFSLNKCHKNEGDNLSDLKLTVNRIEDNISSDEFPKDLPQIRQYEKIFEEEGLPNDEQTAHQRVLYAHYAALRTIARQEYLKAGVSENVIDQVLEVDFPSDPTVKIWTYKDVVNSLGLKVLTDTVGKNYRTYSRRIDNNVKEKIGLRFIKHLIDNTPNFPTQTFFLGGPGVRDVEFRVEGRLVASGNVKLFLDDHPSRQIHMSPEWRDPVHYGLIVKTKPFRLLIFRGAGEEYAGEGSVSDLGWAGFVEDLKQHLK